MRTNIEEVIRTIEAMMSNIHVTLGDLALLVNQIDSITEKLERKYEQKCKDEHSKICLDANRNHCEYQSSPGDASKRTLPSPYLDYTYLELTNPCDNTYASAIENIRFCEKYPLWIQNDTWRTDNTVSDASVVSSGSCTDNLQQSGSDGCIESWKDVLKYKSDGNQRSQHYVRYTDRKTKTADETTINLSKCCKTGSNINDVDSYCGVYEQVMEQQLEHVEAVWDQCDDNSGLGDSFSEGSTRDNLSEQSNCSLSMSDEHVIQFNKIHNTWTAFKMNDDTDWEKMDSISGSSSH